jgi:hypothetical protein
MVEELRMGSNLLDLVGNVGGVINNSVDFVTSLCIDIGQQPVAQDVSLDPPCQRQVSFGSLEIDKAGFRLLDSTICILDGIRLFLSLGFGRCSFCVDGQLKHFNGTLQRIGWIDLITFPQV